MWPSIFKDQGFKLFLYLSNFETKKNGNFSGSKKMFDMETRSLTMLERYIYRPKGTSHRHDTMMLEQCFEVTFWFWNSRQIIHQLVFTIPRCTKLSGEPCANGSVSRCRLIGGFVAEDWGEPMFSESSEGHALGLGFQENHQDPLWKIPYLTILWDKNC